MYYTIMMTVSSFQMLCTQDSQCTPLIISAYKGYTEVVKVLLEAGANVNSQDKVKMSE